MKKVLPVVLVIIIILAILGSCMNGGDKKDTPVRDNPTTSSAPTSKNETKTSTQTKTSQYKASTSPKTTQSAVTEKPAEEPVPEESKATEKQSSFVANTNTHKFHYEWCSSVDKMKESNKWFFTGTRDELIEKGYSPCKICNP